jgi:uncharacterized protein (TIGR02118 family)
MANKPIINIVTTQCQPHEEEKFNKWYNEVHVPMLLKFKGIKSAARYKLISEPSQLPRFIAIYKFDSQKDFEVFEKGTELADAIKEMIGSWGRRIDTISRVQYELIKEW